MRINPKHVGVGLGVVFIMVVLGLSLRHHGGDGGDEGNTSTATTGPLASTAPATQATSSDPKSLVEARASLNKRVAAFVAIYYSFSPQYCEDDTQWKARLTPYATPAFLAQASVDCSSEPNATWLKNGSSAKAEAATDLIGDFVGSPPREADGIVVVRTTVIDQSGKPGVPSLDNQAMHWTKIHGVWLITPFQ